jgi:hypothetical protein
MQKNLKTALIAIFAIGALLAYKNYQLEKTELNANAARKTEITNNLTQLNSFIATNRKQINQLEGTLDSILNQHQKVATKTFSMRSTANVNRFALAYIQNKQGGQPEDIKIQTPGDFNVNNTLVYTTKPSDELYKTMLLTNLTTIANADGEKHYGSNTDAQIAVFRQATQGYGTIDIAPLQKLLQYQYFMVVQHIDALEPQLEGENSFAAGFKKVEISLYEISTGKRLHKVPFVSTNSENIKYIEMNGRPMFSQNTLVNDLAKNTSDGVNKIFFTLKK